MHEGQLEDSSVMDPAHLAQSLRTMHSFNLRSPLLNKDLKGALTGRGIRRELWPSVFMFDNQTFLNQIEPGDATQPEQEVVVLEAGQAGVEKPNLLEQIPSGHQHRGRIRTPSTQEIAEDISPMDLDIPIDPEIHLLVNRPEAAIDQPDCWIPGQHGSLSRRLAGKPLVIRIEECDVFTPRHADARVAGSARSAIGFVSEKTDPGIR